jgi:hypothetical protein
MTHSKDFLIHVSAVRAERNPEKRLKMLEELNESLPESIKIQMPSLITNAYVRTALDRIEERILISV